MIWWVLMAILVVIGYPCWCLWVYVSYVRSRRQYFLDLSDEAKAEIRNRRKKA